MHSIVVLDGESTFDDRRDTQFRFRTILILLIPSEHRTRHRNTSWLIMEWTRTPVVVEPARPEK